MHELIQWDYFMNIKIGDGDADVDWLMIEICFIWSIFVFVSGPSHRSTSSDEPTQSSRWNGSTPPPPPSTGMRSARSTVDVYPQSSSKTVSWHSTEGTTSARYHSVLFEDETITLDQFLEECNRLPRSRVRHLDTCEYVVWMESKFNNNNYLNYIAPFAICATEIKRSNNWLVCISWSLIQWVHDSPHGRPTFSQIMGDSALNHSYSLINCSLVTKRTFRFEYEGW